MSTAATGEVLVARIKQSFEGDVCVRQVYLLMSTNIALRHAVPLATNTTLKTKKREKLSFLSFSTPDKSFLERIFRGFGKYLGVTPLYSRPYKTLSYRGAFKQR